MRVLFLCAHDFANLGYLFAECLRSVGVSALCMVTSLSRLRLGISQAVLIQNMEHLHTFVRPADVIIWMHSQWISLPDMDLTGKKLGVFHGGSKYRGHARMVNRFFNPRMDFTLTQSTEGTMLNRGAKNETWVFPPVDTERLQPESYDIGEKLIIGHFPSQPKSKGSSHIGVVMRRLRDELPDDSFAYTYVGRPVPWKRNIGLIRQCDIYIDSITHAGWGLAILEAAALGVIGIAGFGLRKEYEEKYGTCPLPNLAAMDTEGLYKMIKDLIQTDREVLIQKKKDYRKWVENYHTIEFIGEDLKKAITNAIL